MLPNAGLLRPGVCSDIGSPSAPSTRVDSNGSLSLASPATADAVVAIRVENKARATRTVLSDASTTPLAVINSFYMLYGALAITDRLVYLTILANGTSTGTSCVGIGNSSRTGTLKFASYVLLDSPHVEAGDGRVTQRMWVDIE